jgi:hypothetical protein
VVNKDVARNSCGSGPVVCVGDTITFTASGVTDSGGEQRENCDVVTIPPVTPTYKWTLTIPPDYPDPLPPLSGSGASVGVVALVGGTYSATFTAKADRDCPPPDITIGPGTSQVPTNYSTVEIQYKTFIACEVAGPTPPDPWLYDFFRGDDRGFGYAFGAVDSRTFQRVTVTVDPSNETGLIGTAMQVMGITQGFDDDPDGSDVTPLATPTCMGQCSYGFVPGATPECTGTTPDPVETGKLAIAVTPIDQSHIQVVVTNRAKDQCEDVVPAIDVDLVLLFRQTCEDGILGPLEFKASGSYDGYPWHELYLNGIQVFIHDPCVTGDTPNSMFPFIGNYQFEVDGSNNPTPLADWQTVPGTQ